MAGDPITMTPKRTGGSSRVIAALAGIGFTGFTATDASVVLTAAQADAIGNAGIALAVPSHDTITVADTAADKRKAAQLLPSLAAKAGRVVWNNVPTGVAVCEAMQHGGPWPATSASWSTSVGTEAIKRFVRPVALQGVPEDLFA